MGESGKAGGREREVKLGERGKVWGERGKVGERGKAWRERGKAEEKEVKLGGEREVQLGER